MRRDPTRTLTIRAKYEADLVRRFRKLKALVREAVGKQDALALRTFQKVPGDFPRFDFGTSSDKVDGFMKWLEDQEYAGILEVSRGVPLKNAASASWQNVYLRSAYQKGLAQAAGMMRADGVEVSDRWVDAGFYRPIHADAVGLIYTRAYTDLEGITDAMDQQISRVLAKGLAEGAGPMELADDLADRVEAVGVSRARVLARTETIAAHAEATLNTYDEAGLEGVQVMAEFATADDDQVCPECQALEKLGAVPIDEARGVIPVHPNCRCAWLPIVPDAKGMSLQ